MHAAAQQRDAIRSPAALRRERPITVYNVIDWDAGPDEDLALARMSGDTVQAPTCPAGAHEIGAGGVVVCFRMGELAKAGSGLEPLLSAGRVIDGARLAGIVRPTEQSYELDALAAALQIEHEWAGAEDRVRTAARVWRKLLDELVRLPLAVLTEMEQLLKPTDHPLKPIIESASAQAVKAGFGAAKRVLLDLLPADAPTYKQMLKRPPPRDPPEPLDMETICSMFSPDGALAERFASYEFRTEQLHMVEEACDAFNDGLVLMVEAGTGTGKSLAYLVPAIIWSVKNEDPVVVSTNTKNLQSQLFQKDLPFLEEVLGSSFRYALIKGRANYLCLRKLIMILRAADRELSDAERVDLLPIISWLPNTATGDVADNAGFRPGTRSDLWARISTRPDECLGRRCRWSRRCYVRKARALALQADVIVANHATVFSESGLQSVVLPEYRSIVFDEAHNLEDVATDCFTIEMTPWRVPRVLNRLSRARRGGAGRGLFANLRFQVSRTTEVAGKEWTDGVSDLIDGSLDAFAGVRAANDALFSAIDTLFEGARAREGRIRYDADNRPEDWPAVAQAIADLLDAVNPLASQLERIQKDADTLSKDREGEEPFAGLVEVAAEVGSQANLLRAITESLNTVLRADDEAFVYWLQRGPRRNDTALCAAPLDITQLMNDTVYAVARTAIFTSATLTTAGSFDFMRDRLGMHGPVSERVRTTELGTSFDFPNQALLAVPTFLPEPRYGGPDFIRPFCDLAVQALHATRGRGLVLFTSHAMLRAARQPIQSGLERHGIRVLTQGVDGERSRLMARFAKETSSVLLGTQSFWEGMDVPGESLSCLIVAKLPFRPHTDPIVSARCRLLETHGRNPFGEYMVPDAALRLKQGFGRLIRTRRDRGVVIVCDPRIVKRGYGRAFRDSLPITAQTFAQEHEMIDAISAFLLQPDGPPPSV